jgi:protein O-GlcNAc transferase
MSQSQASQGVASGGLDGAAADLFGRAEAFATAGHFMEAVALYRASIEAAPGQAALHRKLGGVLQATGSIEDAIGCYRRAIELDPGEARAHDELGRLLGQCGDPRGAGEHLRAAIELDPALVSARGALGDLLCREGRWLEGVAELRAAIALDPSNWVLHSFLGSALGALGAEQVDEAMDCFRRVIALAPGNATAHLQLGLAFWTRGDAAPALALVERAVRLDPKLAAAHTALGGMLRTAGRTDEAIASLKAGLAIAPNDGDASFHLGVSLCSKTDDGSVREGLEHLLRATALTPSNVEAHWRLGTTLASIGHREQALTFYRTALSMFPDDPVIRMGATMAELPVVSEDTTAIEQCRASYAAKLDSLDEFFSSRRAGQSAEAARRDTIAVGSAQPFFLAYQGRNDRTLQARYGKMVAGIMAGAYPEYATAPAVEPPVPGEAIRVGIVSGHFWAHSVLKIPIWGWVSLLDRRRFRLFGYHTSPGNDVETARIRRSFDRFVQGPMPVDRWCEIIRADAPHVVIFPEIGMDPTAPKLAGLRHAPLQCCSWGHPTTSGFPTIDYFLSSDLMEPTDADEHYTEGLVRLPNLGVAYVPPPVAPAGVTRDMIGVRADAVAFWCCQLLPKYLPEFDTVFVRIARQVDNAQFVFLAAQRGDVAVDRFRRRLTRAFVAAGLDAERHLVFLSRLSTPSFMGAASVCDVFLDSIGWSGCNSALECLGVNLPIVTLPGSLMRGRHCLAILKMMDVTETIAGSVDEYIDIAVRLGRDPVLRAAIRDKIAANRERLYVDPAPVRALEAWLEGVVRPATA